MGNEKAVLYNLDIICSEVVEDDDSLTSKILICDFEPNENNLMVDRKSIDGWLKTLINKPVVGQLGVSDSGIVDFEGHNLFPVKRVDDSGQVYSDLKFFTSAMGVFTDVAIHKIKNKDYIIATAKIWKRFPEFCAVFKRRIANGNLYTSFEIAVKKYHYKKINGKQIKVVDDAVFLGHALLGSKIDPAYKESRVLEVASQEDNQDLINAILNDIKNINTEQEDRDLTVDLNKENSIDNVEEIKVAEINDVAEAVENKEAEEQPTEIVETVIVEEDKPDVAALTISDLYKELSKLLQEKLDLSYWCIDIIEHIPAENTIWVKTAEDNRALDVKVFTYIINGDNVSISEPTDMKLTVSIAETESVVADLKSKLQEKDESLIKASETLKTLNTEISNLTPYKEKFEKAEQDRISKELAEKQNSLKAYALKSGYISEKEIAESDSLKQMIEKVDEIGIKNVIAERFMETLDKKKEVEVSTANNKTITPKVSIKEDSDVIDYKSLIKTYLRG